MTLRDELFDNPRVLKMINREAKVRQERDALQGLVEAMLDYFQVIPQSSVEFKNHQKKIKFFERAYKEITDEYRQ